MIPVGNACSLISNEDVQVVAMLTAAGRMLKGNGLVAIVRVERRTTFLSGVALKWLMLLVDRIA